MNFILKWVLISNEKKVIISSFFLSFFLDIVIQVVKIGIFFM